MTTQTRTSMRCPRAYCKGRIFDGACYLCGRSPEPVRVLDIPENNRAWKPDREYPTPARFKESYVKTVAYIAEHPMCTSREVAEYLGMQPKSVDTRLNTLEKQGQINRHGPGGFSTPYRWTTREGA